MGQYKAPRSRDSTGEYQYLCLDHIRAFNQGWDFFKGMTPAEIERFMSDAVTGHRPTWKRDSDLKKPYAEYSDAVKEELKRFFTWDTGGKPRMNPSNRIPPKERKALEALELDAPCSTDVLKRQYRALVKRHHPDLHQGDRIREEKFKEITAAYAFLAAKYAKE